MDKAGMSTQLVNFMNLIIQSTFKLHFLLKISVLLTMVRGVCSPFARMYTANGV